MKCCKCGCEIGDAFFCTSCFTFNRIDLTDLTGREKVLMQRYVVFSELRCTKRRSVMLAYDLAEKSVVVVKRLRGAVEDPLLLENCLDIWAGVGGERLVPLVEWRRDGTDFIVVTRFVTGAPLDRVIEPPVEPATALYICAEVSEALETLHKAGLVYVDLKPSNIVVTPRGGILLVDPETVVKEGERAYGWTVEWSAPEAREEPHRVDHRADVYCLGALACWLLTAMVPSTPMTEKWKAIIRSRYGRKTLDTLSETLSSDVGGRPHRAATVVKNLCLCLDIGIPEKPPEDFIRNAFRSSSNFLAHLNKNICSEPPDVAPEIPMAVEDIAADIPVAKQVKRLFFEWIDQFAPHFPLISGITVTRTTRLTFYFVEVSLLLEERLAWEENRKIRDSDLCGGRSHVSLNGLDLTDKELAELREPGRNTSVELPNSCYTVTCNGCGGRGFVSCSACAGKGVLQCRHCNGTGKCPTCHGKGVLHCESCAATGRCPRCGGHGSLKCENCHSTGRRNDFRCYYCNGTGSRVCPECHGSRHCSRCGGTGRKICRSCKGTGTCSHCFGRGTVVCDRCGGTGKLICQTCDGKGRLARVIRLTFSFKRDNKTWCLPPEDLPEMWYRHAPKRELYHHLVEHEPSMDKVRQTFRQSLNRIPLSLRDRAIHLLDRWFRDVDTWRRETPPHLHRRACLVAKAFLKIRTAQIYRLTYTCDRADYHCYICGERVFAHNSPFLVKAKAQIRAASTLFSDGKLEQALEAVEEALKVIHTIQTSGHGAEEESQALRLKEQICSAIAARKVSFLLKSCWQAIFSDRLGEAEKSLAEAKPLAIQAGKPEHIM